MEESRPARMMTRPPTPPMTPARIVGVLLLLLSLVGAGAGDEVLPPVPAFEVVVGEPAEVGLALDGWDIVDEVIVIGGALPPPSDGSEFWDAVVVDVVVAPAALVMSVLGVLGAV